uniref:NADH-ubiquinone oxidoreductase chain 6 n=1 Tax=Pyrocoelia rufa TaxID=71223 RepID=Q8M2C1_PYRRU|nr:NADH dehydrogenase subunit 6 [Pyrocoelia rufa]AAM46713.1 NADH dehydrogenase subunit 6 [Pyrocoelia rufa]
MEMLFWLMSISMMTFLFMEHPMSMGLILLTQTILISMSTSIMGMNSWLSYILFLVMVGGMLILFSYMTSVASNEMFKHSNNLLIMLMSSMMSLMFIMMQKKSILPYFKFNNTDSQMFQTQENFSMILLKYLSFPMMLMWLMLIIYLLITMIAAVKITVIKHGPLRQIN